VVARARLVGPAAAAAEFKLDPALVRKWCSRSKPTAEHVVEASGSTGSESAHTRDGDRLDSMRMARAAARAVEAQAVEQTSTLLAAGNGTEARNAATAGGIWSDKALALDKAIVAAEGEAEVESTRLRSETLELQRDLLRATFAAIDIPVPVASMRELAVRAAAGEPLEVPEEIVAIDRERVRGAIRAEHLAELTSEGWVLADEAHGEEDEADDGEELVDDAEVVDEGEDEGLEALEDDGLPSWDELPEQWKKRHALQRHLGRWEWANELARASARRGSPAPRRQSRWAATSMSHPELG
jgi:hypothetical protein